MRARNALGRGGGGDAAARRAVSVLHLGPAFPVASHFDRPTMLPILLAFALGATTLPGTADDHAPTWAPIVAYDEVRVDADTTRMLGAGPYTVRLRWSFLERASSPTAWDAGVRGTMDLVEVDCDREVTRTFSSVAYGADGKPVPAASFDDPEAPWRAARIGTLGEDVTKQVCGLARARR